MELDGHAAMWVAAGLFVIVGGRILRFGGIAPRVGLVVDGVEGNLPIGWKLAEKEV